MQEKQFGGSGYEGFGSFYNQGKTVNEEEDIPMQAAANYIRNRYYKEALNVLSHIEKRTARWYYFSAVSNSGVGNNVVALEHAKIAVSMEPSNYEYRQFMEYMQNGGTWYTDMGSVYRNPAGGVGRWCISVLLLNLFCNLFCCGNGGRFYYQ